MTQVEGSNKDQISFSVYNMDSFNIFPFNSHYGKEAVMDQIAKVFRDGPYRNGGNRLGQGFLFLSLFNTFISI